MWLPTCKILLSFCVCAVLNLPDHIYRRRENIPTSNTVRPIITTNRYESLKLRHQSRFPNLDRIMNGIHHKREHHTTTPTTTTTTDEGLFEEYYYDDVDNNDEDFDEWVDNDGDSNEYEDEDVMDGWQNEEATEKNVVLPERQVSSLTKLKWDTLGTQAKVEETRQQHYNLNSNSQARSRNAVVEHFLKVRIDAQCRRPLPRVISVQSEHPDNTKTYTPPCTILFRCADDTGCCTTFGTRCGPKTQVPVELYFYTKTLDKQETRVEKLTFSNHTECECISKSKPIPATTPPVAETEENELFSDESSFVSESDQRCKKCPKEFTPKFRYSQGCICDCEDYNQDCLGMKYGEEYFSLTDRMCIKDNECGIPTCEYGIYLRHEGKCPRKHQHQHQHV